MAKDKPYWRKTPCKHCPFRHDVRPFLTDERAMELAYHTHNPYNTFPCHKTTVSDEEFGGDGFENVAVNTSQECAGFLTLRYNELGEVVEQSEGFIPATKIVYSDAESMIYAYEEENDR